MHELVGDRQMPIVLAESLPQRDRLKRIVVAGWSAVLLAAALPMLAAPASWYAAVPGVVDSGPYNPHFVRDIGVAYLVQAVLAATAAVRPHLAHPLLSAVALYLGLHAGLHLWDIAAGRMTIGHLTEDLPGVFLPALVAISLVFWNRNTQA
jgi:hypothetical protein